MLPATGTERSSAAYGPPAAAADTRAGSVMLPVPRAADPRLSGHSGLTWRIFLNGAAIVATVLGVTLAATWISAQRAADQSVQRGLDATRDRVAAMLSEQQARLASGAQTYVANNIDFRSHLEQLASQPDSVSAADYLDQAQTVAGAIGANWVQLIGPEGVLRARSDDSVAAPVDLSGSPLVGPALGGEVTSGFGVRGDTALFYAVSVPIFGAGGRSGGSEIGVLMAARYVGDALAVSAGRETGSEVLFYALDRDDKPAIVATTPALADRRTIRQWLSDRMMGAKATADASDSARREDAVIGGRHFVGQGSPLLSASGTPMGGFVALRDRDAELGAFRQLRTTILYAAAAGLLLAFLLSALVARQITRPVRALALASGRAADGDYGAEIPQGGRDEIGALADAFRDLLADLRDKQALVELLQSPGAGVDGRTVPMSALTPSMQQQAMGSGAVLEPGQVIANRYEIVSVLGVGGMGVVYRATDRELGDPLAIKTLRPDLIAQDPSALDRFKSEIRLARRISHRNVVRTHDLGEFGGVYYITMEFVEGKTLKELIAARGKLPAPAVLPIAKQLCRALDVAHQAGVIHRDIKPQNMVVEPGGVLKVMDFGIARLAERTTGHTQTGMIVGTPQYMAPEQLMGAELDARADLYAVGCVLYECLTGRPPHQADTLVSLITRIMEETPMPPAQLASDVPERLSALVMRTLAKDRAARPASADELHDLLAAIG